MEMLPPDPSVVVGATVEKRFPGYGIHRGTIAEINDRQVVLALSGGELVYFELDASGQLGEVEKLEPVIRLRRNTRPDAHSFFESELIVIVEQVLYKYKKQKQNETKTKRKQNEHETKRNEIA